MGLTQLLLSIFVSVSVAFPAGAVKVKRLRTVFRKSDPRITLILRLESDPKSELAI